MSDSTTTNYIDALQAQLMKAREDEGWFITGDQAKDFSRALTALVAQRDALRRHLAELEALSKPVYFAHGQRLESIDLRERLVCAIWPEMLRIYNRLDPDGKNWDLVRCNATTVTLMEVDAMLKAMRQGGGA